MFSCQLGNISVMSLIECSQFQPFSRLLASPLKLYLQLPQPLRSLQRPLHATSLRAADGHSTWHRFLLRTYNLVLFSCQKPAGSLLQVWNKQRDVIILCSLVRHPTLVEKRARSASPTPISLTVPPHVTLQKKCVCGYVCVCFIPLIQERHKTFVYT